MRLHPPAAFVASVVAVILVAAACGVSRTPDAAATLIFPSGRTASVSADQLDSLLDEISASEDFVQLAYGGTVPPGLKSSILGLLILTEMQNEELAEMGSPPVPDSAVATLKSELDGELVAGFNQSGNPTPEESAAQVSTELPNYLDVIATRLAGEELLTEALVSDSEPPVQTLVCSRHILLSTEEEADEAVDRLNQGEDFAALAIELSTGPSGPSGGDLGCADPAGFVPEFAAAITGAPVDEVIGPVQTSFGFHVIRVDGVETQPVPVNGQELFFASIGMLSNETTVTVEPLFGAWDPQALTVLAP